MKKLTMLAVMLAALLVAAAPAFGQEDPYPEEDLQPPPEVTVTGVLGGPATPEGTFPEYLLFEEETGKEWRLVSKASEGGVDLSQYVGQRVTINGGIPQTLGPVPDPLPEDYDLTQYPLFVPEGTLETVGGDSSEEGPLAQAIRGTAASEALYGTYGPDIIEGLRGDDLLVGEAGQDQIFGGPGADYLVTGYAYFQQAPNAPASSDYVEGGKGNDLIDSADLAGAPDDVYCGSGDDLVYAGVEDNVANDCEVVYRYFGF